MPINPALAQDLAEAERYGVDLSMLRERLKMTPEERIERHAMALALAGELRAAGRRAGLAPNTTPPDYAYGK